MKEQMTIQLKDVQELLETFSLLNEKSKEIALATLTGMRLVSEVDRKNRKTEKIS